jgi:LPXTG-motif cell wall-anchored protein
MNKLVFFSFLLIVLILPATVASADISASMSGIEVDKVTQSPSPARPGETVELSISIQNVGDEDLSDIVVSLNPEYPFTSISGQSLTKKISFLEARQDEEDGTILKFNLKVDPDIAEDTYDIDVVVKDSGSDAKKITPLNIDIQGKEYAQVVTISDSNIDLATVEPLEFVITNTGDAPIKNMEFSWKEPTGVVLPVYSSTSKYIKYLGVGESANVSYSVMADVNANPGLYQLDLTLQFQDYNSDNSTIQTKAGIFVGGKTDFDLSYSESDGGEVSLSLANVGNNEAYSVKLSIPEQDNFVTTGSSSSIVGNLEKGDYTVTSFSISRAGAVASDAEAGADSQAQARSSFEKTAEDGEAVQQQKDSANELLVLIEYTDSTGQRLSVEKAVQIEDLTSGTMGTAGSMGPGPGRTGSNTYLYAVALILIAGGLVFYRKKKMEKEGNYEPIGVQLGMLKRKILGKDKE